jgi:hypothetical protein
LLLAPATLRFDEVGTERKFVTLAGLVVAVVVVAYPKLARLEFFGPAEHSRGKLIS